MRFRIGGGGGLTEPLLHVAAEGIDKDQFGAERRLMIPVHASSPLGPSQLDPVGSAVTGAAKALFLDQGFQQQWPVAVKALPVVGQLARTVPQDLAG